MSENSHKYGSPLSAFFNGERKPRLFFYPADLSPHTPFPPLSSNLRVSSKPPKFYSCAVLDPKFCNALCKLMIPFLTSLPRESSDLCINRTTDSFSIGQFWPIVFTTLLVFAPDPPCIRPPPLCSDWVYCRNLFFFVTPDSSVPP